MSTRPAWNVLLCAALCCLAGEYTWGTSAFLLAGVVLSTAETETDRQSSTVV